MLLQILFCAGMAAFLLLLGVGLLALFLLPLQGRGIRLILMAKGDGSLLEHQCRAYLFLRGLGFLGGPLYLVDAGLSPSGLELARALTRLDGQIRLCPEPELPKLLHNGE